MARLIKSVAVMTVLFIGFAFAKTSVAISEVGVNPGYNLMTLRPSGFEPQVAGLDFMPNGDMLLLTWRGNNSWPPQEFNGTGMYKVMTRTGTPKLYKVTNTKGSDVNAIVRTEIASGFKDAMGLCVVNGVIYVGDIDRIVKLVDTNGDGYYEDKVEICRLPSYDGWYEYAFGPVHKDGKLYMALAVGVNSSGYVVNQFGKDRGTVLSVPITGGAYTVLAEGLRAPNGIGIGPEGEIFVTDNQGGWRPSSQLHHIKQGRFFGYFTEPVGLIQKAVNNQVTPPVLYLPYKSASDSPTEPALMTTGMYQGQFFFGDISRGGLYRAFLEKIGGEYQGSLMVFSGGLEVGVNRIRTGPQGEMYFGGLGDGSSFNHGWNGKTFGLQKLTPKANPAFEILATRSRATGMELEFTAPVGSSAYSPGNYIVRTWKYTPTSDYGGNPVGTQTLTVKNIQVSTDQKKVFLEIEGLKTGQVVHINTTNITSQDNQTLWYAETWYTLNAISPSTPFTVSAIGKKTTQADNNFLRLENLPGKVRVHMPVGIDYRVDIVNPQGTVLRSEPKVQGSIDFITAHLPTGVYFVRAFGAGTVMTRGFFP